MDPGKHPFCIVMLTSDSPSNAAVGCLMLKRGGAATTKIHQPYVVRQRQEGIAAHASASVSFSIRLGHLRVTNFSTPWCLSQKISAALILSPCAAYADLVQACQTSLSVSFLPAPFSLSPGFIRSFASMSDSAKTPLVITTINVICTIPYSQLSFSLASWLNVRSRRTLSRADPLAIGFPGTSG